MPFENAYRGTERPLFERKVCSTRTKRFPTANVSAHDAPVSVFDQRNLHYPHRESRPQTSLATKHHLYDAVSQMYDSTVATMNVSDARNHLLDAMETARTETVFLQRRGRLAGVLVSPERYEQLMGALEDAEDVAAFDAAMAEEGPNIPWDQVKSDLGWE